MKINWLVICYWYSFLSFLFPHNFLLFLNLQIYISLEHRQIKDHMASSQFTRHLFLQLLQNYAFTNELSNPKLREVIFCMQLWCPHIWSIRMIYLMEHGAIYNVLMWTWWFKAVNFSVSNYKKIESLFIVFTFHIFLQTSLMTHKLDKLRVEYQDAKIQCNAFEPYWTA